MRYFKDGEGDLWKVCAKSKRIWVYVKDTSQSASGYPEEMNCWRIYDPDFRAGVRDMVDTWTLTRISEDDVFLEIL